MECYALLQTHKENKMTKELLPKLPEFKVNPSKNGYEIRTEILAMAKDVVQTDFNYKFHGWEITAKRDDKGAIVTTVDMPAFPGLDTILDAAERMYSFVNTNTPQK